MDTNTVLIGEYEIPVNVLAPAVGTLIGAAIGGALTILGVVITNATNAKLKREEREMALRKEVFLKSAEDFEMNLKYLNAFADLSLEAKDIAAFTNGMGSTVGKMHMIADVTTIEAISKAHRYLLSAAQDLALRRFPLLEMSDEVSSLREQLQSSPRDSVLRAEHDKTKTELFRRHMEFRDRVQQHVEEYGKRLIDANLHVREEIGLPINGSSYRKVMEEHFQQSKALSDKFRDELKKLSGMGQ